MFTVNTTQYAIGDRFPDITLPALGNGALVPLASLFDRPTCIFVWASW
jgi:hypothetical protein